MNHDVRMIEVAELGSEESGEESKVDNKTVKQYLPIRLRHNVRWRLQMTRNIVILWISGTRRKMSKRKSDI